MNNFKKISEFKLSELKTSFFVVWNNEADLAVLVYPFEHNGKIFFVYGFARIHPHGNYEKESHDPVNFSYDKKEFNNSKDLKFNYHIYTEEQLLNNNQLVWKEFLPLDMNSYLKKNIDKDKNIIIHMIENNIFD